MGIYVYSYLFSRRSNVISHNLLKLLALKLQLLRQVNRSLRIKRRHNNNNNNNIKYSFHEIRIFKVFEKPVYFFHTSFSDIIKLYL